MAEKPIKIVLTGAESTGKTILSEALANHYGTIWIPEIARLYVENLDRHYEYDDVLKIAGLQIEAEKNIKANPSPVFIDEWLLNTKVWIETLYGACPEWIEEHIKSSSIDLFLFCDIDIPWVNDPVRENGGETRVALHEKYLKCYQDYGLPVKIVKGDGEARLINAVRLVDEFINR